jgi:ABC-type multidrug transport system fused ATPase/permease subunit
MDSLHNYLRRSLLARLWVHLSSLRRRQFFLMLVLMFMSTCAEVISLGAVLPFLGILTAPHKVYGHPVVSELAWALGLTSADQLVLPITLAFVSAVVFAGVIRIALLWLSTRLAFGSGADFSLEIYRRTLYQPYAVHISRRSSEVISGISNKVAIAVSVLYQTLILITSFLLIVALTAALLVMDFRITVISCLVFGGVYSLLLLLSRHKLNRNSQLISKGQTQVVKALQEGLGGIREVLLYGAQLSHCREFNQASQQFRQAQGNNQFLSGSPRFAVETLGIVLIVALAYALSLQPEGILESLPVLGALALGAQRLLPALQQAYNAWATIRGSQASLAATIELLEQPVPAELLLPAPIALRFVDAIQLENVKFRYSPQGPWVLNGLTLTIRKGEKVAIVGGTGSGKSTALDMLMGLINPDEGRFLVDECSLPQSQVRAWQRTIAHVPQNIFLADATVAQNIAFGVPAAEIDMSRVHRAAVQAQIADFIESHDKGYDAMVGERGVKLSGGQRQRIGIARALYKEAEVLVFDEATSALDNNTERAVMEPLLGSGRQLTVILIAHRLTMVRDCSRIFELEEGRVVRQGSYDELLSSGRNYA